MRPLLEHQRTLKLTIVSTPIGNLQDISLRALEALSSVDYILCEDTRRAQKLKNHFQLPPKLLSFHEHNEKERIPQILSLVEQGKTFALISDAGTPLLSDPGRLLVLEFIQQQLPFTYVPGPSAVIASLVLSGFSSQPFSFVGFLPTAQVQRSAAIANLSQFHDHTLVIFESPDRILGLIREIGEVLGNRNVAVCRELTKLHEEIIRGTVSDILTQLSGRKLQGEFTIVVAPGEAPLVEMSETDLQSRYGQLLSEGFSKKEALKKLIKESGRARNELYRLLIVKD